MHSHSIDDLSRNIRVAFIGLGERGQKALRLMLDIEGVAVAALCDLSADHVEAARASLGSSFAPQCFDGADAYLDLCHAPGVDLVYLCSDWDSHARIALEAMRSGKDVAVEVPAAMTLEDIRALVAVSEETDRRCFMLENVCFEQQVIDAIDAIRRGDIGELVHAEGCYYHHLGDRWNPWRLEINRRLRGDLYPTHELGPICMAMDIGRSDRLQTLVSMDTAALTGPVIYMEHAREEAPDFQNGDHTTTLIRTARGRTILLKHDVLTAQPYQRELLFIGTQGSIRLCDTGHASHEAMTQTMNRHLIESLRTGSPLAISVRDMATWCAAIPLSRLSIERHSAPVDYPDFYA